MKINLNPVQVIAMMLVILGAITGGTAQLTDIVGPGATKIAVAVASLATSIMSGWIMILTGQANLVQQVQAMPGIEKITVNAAANQTLAALAVDEANTKIEATPQADAAVTATAKGP